jgi:hypothetical protein
VTDRRRLYGLLAEFGGPDELLAAAASATEAGYRRKDAYTPFPVHGLPEALGFRRPLLAKIVFAGALLGGLLGYLLQYYGQVHYYPLDIGGRPHHSWPAYIVITFETTILGGALAAVLGMLGLNGLPEPHHPLFNVERFELATRDRFFLCIEAKDARFDLAATRAFLESLGPKEVFVVED